MPDKAFILIYYLYLSQGSVYPFLEPGLELVGLLCEPVPLLTPFPLEDVGLLPEPPLCVGLPEPPEYPRLFGVL